MKIGILTFHYAYNFGALFQAVSLYDYLKSLGHEVYMVDYRNSKILKSYKLYPSLASNKNYRFYLTLPIRILMRFMRFRNFDNFIKENLSLISIDKIDTLACLIVGSDQVWNIKLTDGYDPFYWGDISFNGLKIAYAASMNTIKLSAKEKSEIKKKLTNFNSVSVRELAMIPLLQPLTEQKINLVLDPTMLNDFDYWSKRAGNAKCHEKYVLAYPLRDGKTVLKIAEKIACERGATLKIIRGDVGWNPFSKIYNTAGPKEALSLIKNAEFVVTSSFHGTVVSILMKKQFYTIKCNDGNNVRTESILKLLHLQERLINEKTGVPTSSIIDYSIIDPILSLEQKKSQLFLINNLYGQ